MPHPPIECAEYRGCFIRNDGLLAIGPTKSLDRVERVPKGQHDQLLPLSAVPLQQHGAGVAAQRAQFRQYVAAQMLGILGRVLARRVPASGALRETSSVAQYSRRPRDRIAHNSSWLPPGFR